MATSPFQELKKAVSRLVDAEVAYSTKWLLQSEEEQIRVQQNLDNARSNYKYWLEKLRMAFYTKEGL